MEDEAIGKISGSEVDGHVIFDLVHKTRAEANSVRNRAMEESEKVDELLEQS
jgi:hypothetical protein